MVRQRSLRNVVLVITSLVVAGVAVPSARAARPPRAAVIVVSPHGNAANPGSAKRPIRTIAHAQELVRTMDSYMSADITVALMSGTYRLAAPLELDARDSGTNGHDVIWTAAPGARPVLSGGEQISGWRPSDVSKGIWSAPAPAGLQTRQLYVDGVRAQRASGPVPTSLTANDTGYTTTADPMATWRNPGDIEMVYTGGDGYWSLHTGGQGAWTEPRCPVASITDTAITMAQPCWDNSNKRVMRTDGSGRTVELVGPESLGNSERPAFVENAYELLDQPGEWYLDRSEQRIYYIPRHGEDLGRADVEVPILQKLVEGQGTATAPVHDIVFAGIQFSYATWLAPSTPEGFSEIQAGYTITGPTGYVTQGLCQFIDGGTCPFGNWTKEPGNVSFVYDTNIQFLDDAFVHLGAAGLDLGDGSQNDLVKGSVFTDISGNGLEIGGVDIPEPQTQAEHTSGVQVLDNHLYSLPVEFHGGVGIDVGYAEHTMISHNQLDHTAYTAISLGWGGWPDKIKIDATPNYSNNNTVSHNLITDTMQVLGDGGAIYTQGITGTSLADGEHLTGNVILRAYGHGHAIYSDNGSTFMTITGNVLFGNENDWGSRHTDYAPGASGYDPLDIEGNYWQQGDADSSSKNVTEQGNHIIVGSHDVPASVLRDAGLPRAYRRILAERVGGPSAPLAPTQIASFALDGAADIGWNPSYIDHGGRVTSYTVTASPGGRSRTVSAADFQRLGYAVVDGLTDGTAYTFTVRANSRYGTGAPSLPTAAVTPHAGLGAVPNAPTSFDGHADGTKVSLNWNPPSSTGGTPITGYTISAASGPPLAVTGHTEIWATSSRNIFTTLGGLAPLKPYTFQITADNAAGHGIPAAATVVPGTSPACSGASLSVTPASSAGEQGATVDVTTTLTDGCVAAMTGAKIYLSATNGYQVSPAGPVTAGDVAVGGSATQHWTVTVPSDATAGSQLLAVAVYAEDGQSQSEQRTAAISVPAPSLAAAFDNVGITDDANTTIGNFDGAGSSLSAQALAADGATPGATVTYNGVPFTWPDVPAGANDNAIADGRAFDVTGSGSRLSFLLTAGYGPAAGTGTVVYSDGSREPFQLTSPDWHGGCKSATDPGVVLYLPYRNRTSGPNTLPVCVFYASTPIQSGKIVAQIVLPDVSADVTSGQPSMHVFAVSIT